MTMNRDVDTILAAWLDEGPVQLPDGTRRAILTALPTASQLGRRTIPRLLPRRDHGSAWLVGAALLAAAAIAAAVFAIGSLRNVSPTPPAATAPLIQPTSLPGQTAATSDQTPSPLDGNVGAFAVNFTYRLPAGAGIVVSRSENGLWQFRVPTPGVEEQYHAGVIVRAVEGGRLDPCREGAPVVDFAPGARSVMDYLAGVPTTSLADVRNVTIDGRPALQATLHVGAATTDCPNVWLWNGTGSITENAGHDIDVDMRVIEIEGRHIAIYSVGDRDWWPTGQQLVDSFRFDAPRPTASGGP